MSDKIRNDDFSCDPRKWSFDKLRRERRNGMPAVTAEWTRRMEEHDRGPDVTQTDGAE